MRTEELSIFAYNGKQAAVLPPLITGAIPLPAIPLPKESSGFLAFLAARKYRNAQGRVVEVESNRPLGGATVTLLDKVGKPLRSVRTKADGIFVFLLPPGVYRLNVTLRDYAFDPQAKGIVLIPGEQGGERLYAGGTITLPEPRTPQEAIFPPIVVALRPLKARPRVSLRDMVHVAWLKLRIFQSRLTIPALLFGAILNTIALWTRPTAPLIAFEILYGVLLAMEILLSRVVRRGIGHVRDSLTQKPVPLAVVRLIEEDTGRIVNTFVTSGGGAFVFMPRPGAYRVSVIHPRYEARTQRVHIFSWSPTVGKVTVPLEPKGR